MLIQATPDYYEARIRDLQSQLTALIGYLNGGYVALPGEFDLGSGKGPFIAGETWNSFSGASGLSGTFRVKMLPWNAVWLDFFGSISSTGTTFNMGTLPNINYYPSSIRRFPVACTGGPTAWLYVPTNGGLQLLLSGAANGSSVSTSFIYPTN